MGGGARDLPESIAIDGSGNAYVAGHTFSYTFPISSGAYQTSFGGGWEDIFISKFDSSGSNLVYSTYLGGSETDRGFGLVVDSSGNAVVGGMTFATDYPTTAGALDTSLNGNTDAVLTKMNAAGNGLIYSTYLGGDSSDHIYGVAQDGNGNVYLTGETSSSNFPKTTGAYDESHNGGTDVFITKFNSALSSLAYSTYIGGNSGEYGYAIAVDGSGSAHITGKAGINYPTTANAYDASFNGGGYDVFVTTLNPAGNALLYSTYLGGNDNDYGYGIAVDGTVGTYVTGQTESSDFPTTTGAYDESYNGGDEAFISKFFTQIQYTLTLAASAGGTTDPSPGTHNYVSGSQPSVQAIPNLGYIFSNWTGDVPSGHENDNPLALTMDKDLSLTAIFTQHSSPIIALSRTSFNFGATTAGLYSSAQQFNISNSWSGLLDWAVSDNASWLDCTPSTGTSNAEVITATVNPAGQPVGSYNAVITVESTNATNSPQTVTVTLNVYGLGANAEPFGSFDTPVHGTTVMSSIPVTGWVLDDIGVESVKIYRDPVNGGENLVYIGDAVLVEGARPDVEQAYPGYPYNYQAGWGYMMLTNFLPNQGNGTFVIHAYANDKDGHSVSLGSKTITCDNAHAVKPFGAIDTPRQGENTTDKFFNAGWALTPMPNEILKDGSTINVWVDGKALGHPAYNQYRVDIATLFPGYANTDGAVGAYYLDTTTYTNGVHTIAWSVSDNGGNSDGIGSRFFSIANTGGSSQTEIQSHKEDLRPSLSYESILNMPVNFDPIKYRRGYREGVKPEIARTDEYGKTILEIREVDRIEIELEKGVSTGYLVVGDKLRLLPIGSTLDREKGIFYWQPGPGFIGDYEFVFIREDEYGMQRKIQVEVNIRPKFGMDRMDIFQNAKAKGA